HLVIPKISFTRRYREDTLNLPVENLKEMTKTLQRDFLRKPGIERWHMKEVPYKKKDILPFLEKLGFMDEVLPSQEINASLNYIFIHGAHVERMRDRINFLLTKIWPKLSEDIKKRVHIVFLTGDRKLDVETDEKETLFSLDLSKTSMRPGWTPPSLPPIKENDAARILWDQLVFDKTLRERILFVDTPRPIANHRPTTRDTLIAWLDSLTQFQKDPNSVSLVYRSFWENAAELKTSNILAISNNPFIPYQDLIFRNFLREEGLESVCLETVGSKASANVLIAVHLDNLARTLQETLNTLT
ncbi:MAG TPA: hypothetical protein PLY23_09650, partial [Alphaproteobacteria bacterium]|nr:hypothetical protein [Alphaproteobacteria bacterium]HQS94863.1 hypothetical protein [Alphaproteobacteria bacterium]